MADNGGAGGAESAVGPPPPDTSDMLAVHGALRDTLASGSRLVRSVDPGDAERRELVADYYGNILWFLQVHHDGEEELVFPKVRQRAPAAAPIVDAMKAQHEEVVQLLADADRSLAAWRGGDIGAQARLAGDLDRLSDAVAPHLDQEESDLLPLCGQTMTIEEWGELPGHALSQYQGDKVWLILGLIMERRTPEGRQVMLEHMPPPVAQMWRDVGHQAFDDLQAKVG